MNLVLPFLPKKWNLVGRTDGSDLGNDVFQFRFEDEADLQMVLRNRPYHYGRWMLLIQRWEPVISASFPSQIPFWINIRGIPLHYWHEKVVSNIGREIGHLDAYEVTKSSARVRCTIDGLKPLIMEPVLDFDSGEESNIYLEYENLGNHCSYCFRLTHLQSQCPEKQQDLSSRRSLTQLPSPARNDLLPPPTFPMISARNDVKARTNYRERLDRYGNPFGDRVSTQVNRVQGPRNKIAPSYAPIRPQREEMVYRPKEVTSQHNTSPSYSHRRKLPAPGQTTPDISKQTQRVWRSKTPPAMDSVNDEVHSPMQTLRPLERNLDADFHQGQLPTVEEVLDEINEATRLYTNVDDPVERAARQQRVLQSEIDGSVEETVERIIQHSAASLGITTDPIITLPPSAATEQDMDGTSQETTAPKRRGRPPRARSARTIQLSPRVFLGTSLRRRNLSQVGASPGSSKQAATRPADSSTQALPAQIPSSSGGTSRVSANKRPRLDFPEDRLHLP